MSRNETNGSESRRIGAFMKRQRLALGLSQGQVAHALGVTQTQIAKYEAGATELPVNKLRAVLNVLQTDIGLLLGIEPHVISSDDLPAWTLHIARRLVQLDPQDRAALTHVIHAMADKATAA